MGSRMTLRRTMAMEIGATILGLLLISGASLWGINALHQDFHSSIEGYRQLRQVYEVGSHVATAKTLLTIGRPDEARAEAEIRTAADTYELYAPGGDLESADATGKLRLAVRAGLMQAVATSDPWQRIEALNGVLAQVANLASEIRRRIEQAQAAADANRRAAMILMSVLSGVVIVGAVCVGVWQYRSVMRPLNRLRAGVHAMAAGRFGDRVAAEGHAEFAELAGDFNRMAGELDELYRKLEEKVAQKSKELVRSERLASVGFLAAGVAHEINNPIGIIAGQAELMLREVAPRESSGFGVQGSGGGVDSDQWENVRKTLRVICEEAFRCKEIVGKLLSLARPGEENRARIPLAEVARGVVGMVGALKEYRGRRVEVHVDPGERLDVLASEGDMKQVVLNLVINALEAEGSVVRVDVGRVEGMVQLAVSDNGRGMSGEVVERVFEPFFTAKRGTGQRGVGLGLSITHAIVASHGGSIRAESEGVGKGSRFVVRLPAAEGGAV